MSNRAKGNRTEREAVELYKRAGYYPVDRVGATGGGRRMTDAFGHVDIIAIGDGHLRFVQAKTNTGSGVRDYFEWAVEVLPDYIEPDFIIRHDGAGGRPVRWRLQRAYVTDEVSYRTVVDERKDGVPAGGEAIVEWLQEESDG